MTSEESRAFHRVVKSLDEMCSAAQATILNQYASLEHYAREQPEGHRLICESRAAINEGRLSLIGGKT